MSDNDNAITVVVPSVNELSALKYLTPEENEQAKQLAANLNVTDSMAVINFAAKPQKDMTSLTDPIMKTVATKDTGAAGEALTDLLQQVKALNAASFAQQAESWVTQIPIIGGMFSNVQHFISQYEKIGAKIDRITVQLDQS